MHDFSTRISMPTLISARQLCHALISKVESPEAQLCISLIRQIYELSYFKPQTHIAYKIPRNLRIHVSNVHGSQEIKRVAPYFYAHVLNRQCLKTFYTFS